MTPPPLPSLHLWKIALIGNPNTGKSTLFNALSGLQSRVGNYPGVTVEKKIGKVTWNQRPVELIDLPGTYSLAPRSLDEMVSVNVLLGHQAEIGSVQAVICIVDASNLERNLYLFSQLLDLRLPLVLVLNLWDVARERGIQIDREGLEKRLGVPVVVTCAHRKTGIAEIPAAVERAMAQGVPPHPMLFPQAFTEEASALGEQLRSWGQAEIAPYLLTRLLLDVGGWLEGHQDPKHAGPLKESLAAARERLANKGCRVPAIEAKVRYAWVRQTLTGLVTQPVGRPTTWSDRVDHWLTHRYLGLTFFTVLMFFIFQMIYAGAAPAMDLCEAAQGWFGEQVSSRMAPGPLRSLLVDGVIAGVGGVLVFLPQIVLLFFFIALLEDCGYMARAAFLMDKLMTRIGLSGKSFVPLMSSFACAVPGVMATRVIENSRDRLLTILIAPLMSCSARLPVYLLLISLFVPRNSTWLPWLDMHGLVLFIMTALGSVVAIPVAWVLKKTLLKGETPPFVMELPSYKIPSAWIVLRRVWDSALAFVNRAGTLIFATSVLVWAAAYFPGDHRPAEALQSRIEQLAEEFAEPLSQLEELEEQLAEEVREDERQAANQQIEKLRTSLEPYYDLVDQRNQIASRLLEESYLGRVGHAIEPVVRPLGWDWRIGVGVLASFPAREVIIATLGTIYSLGSDVSETDEKLYGAMRESRWASGEPVYNLPVAVSLMVFFALCAQCMSTLLVIRRETNSWSWTVFTFVYMTGLAYIGALLSYQIGMRL